MHWQKYTVVERYMLVERLLEHQPCMEALPAAGAMLRSALNQQKVVLDPEVFQLFENLLW